MRRRISDYGLYAACFVAIIATAGSLYFSEIARFEPCKLCWLQRIMMYPLVILLGIAAYENNRSIVKYALPFSVIGGCISLWHVLELNVPALAEFTPCTVGIPCNFDYLNWFGFITIPLLALIAFILITALLIIVRKAGDSE
ncbi:disulfide oxidoreductase [Paenibacillus sp. MSJ-34]|uniref:disulfide oxidoreductase n=1 Tax=Paenibacillus sp. MSJ-34 TaxID=2841529 RepID=UPI001C11DC42|nr:disulfide oxidoreductase [Paenibacillus sp. MSJ-34]MBU5443957.1 disulfide bond formation protein B [Paenibacillus sp. MSJ-34]